MNSAPFLFAAPAWILVLALALGAESRGARAATAPDPAPPRVTSLVASQGNLILAAEIPAGFRHAVLESAGTVVASAPVAVVAGALPGNRAVITFRFPQPAETAFLRVRLGTDPAVPPAAHTGAPYFSVDDLGGGPTVLDPEEKAGHLLNRLAYGPSPTDLQAVESLGISAWIEQQLHPETIDESANSELRRREAALFTTHQPRRDEAWIAVGDSWRYFKGTTAPPADWRDRGFEDSGWSLGASGFGYGDDDDATVLNDMRQAGGRPGYLTLFVRKTFIPTSTDLDALILRVDYDDGFVAYLNGTEVARAGVTGAQPGHTQSASTDHEAGEPVEFDISASRNLLVPGENVLAIQLHNAALGSSDATLIPALIARRYLPGPTVSRIKSLAALQQLIHVRGIYARRQLQAVLAEFWENHFTTDYDKVAEYLGNLRNSNANTAMSPSQAALEAAQAELYEYEFFHQNAFGNFGDLLLFSATSPAQLIYLDNVLNLKGAANENYAREILELFAFGVDNRYTQKDIEELARCFTGWTIRKVYPQDRQSFPASARNPPTSAGVQYQDVPLVDLGPGWKYAKGTNEPSPGPAGAPTTQWTQPGFDDSSWSAGSTGIGYGDNDDETVLSDMRNRYLSVYLRREFSVADPAELQNLVLTVDFDDGFVAYLNGTEIARSETMEGTGTPPPYNASARGSREAGSFATFPLGRLNSLFRFAPEKNVLAIQAHNLSRDSSDLSLRPRLVRRELLPGSVENGDSEGVWTFRFNPGQHDVGAKILFAGTPHEIRIPAGRTGLDGLRDAQDVIDTFVNHPSVSEFICLKLINKLVSDEISLASYRDGTAPEPLRQLLQEAIQAWHSTQPAGNLRTVVRAILRPASQDGYFWSRAAYRAKLKTPVEFINSTVRALQADASGTSLPDANDRIGMHLFNRDDPDGWSELGVDWIDTGTLLARLQFVRSVAAGQFTGVRWDAAAWTRQFGLTTAESVIDHFNHLLFQGRLSEANRQILLRFVSTDDNGNPLPFDPARADYQTRLRELVGLILSMPQWHYQ